MLRLISLLVAALTVFSVGADTHWKMHPTFDEAVTRVIDTPDFVYFTSRTQPYDPESLYNSTEFLSLFRYDKGSEEIECLSTDNLLSSNTVSCLEYSPEKRCLVVVYVNSDIDIIYDDGRTANISAYREASMAHDKKVNHIFIDSGHDRIYLSTGFGIVALNDKKQEVADSRIYGREVKSVSRLGDKLLILSGDRLLSTPAARPAMSANELKEELTLRNPSALAFVSPSLNIAMTEGGIPEMLHKITENGDGKLIAQPLAEGDFINVERNNEGATFASTDKFYWIGADGSLKTLGIASEDRGAAMASRDMSEVWFGAKRKGLWSRKSDGASGWTTTRDMMLPNSPAPFMATEMTWHPQRGLLVSNHGYSPDFPVEEDGGPVLLSAYKDGMWSNLSRVYTSPDVVEPMKNPNGLAVDPDNPDLVYFGSLMSGMERINMEDGADALHFSRRNDPHRHLPGFVPLVADQTGNPSPLPGIPESWAASCPFAAPMFDASGNLWTSYADYDDQRPYKLHLICWTAENRRATTSASDVKLPEMVEVEGIVPGNKEVIVPLFYRGHANLLAYAQRSYGGGISVIDTNGTPTDTSDDKVVSLSSFYDQDGNSFEVHDIRFLKEDSSTGNVWVGHQNGVFHFNPGKLLEGSTRVSRIKVARGDGTNLADYLLDGVPVCGMTADGAGRKWFATGGAGVICTSADGRDIIWELTSENSPLPDDYVLGAGFIPTTNSIMLSTRRGMAEHFIRSGGSSSDGGSVRAYPNPVRPDYYGYVTIDGLPDESLVKIVDASGNIVKELHAASGEARWDVTNMAFKRVSSGVYFILASSMRNQDNYSEVAKVLVVSN